MFVVCPLPSSFWVQCNINCSISEETVEAYWKFTRWSRAMQQTGDVEASFRATRICIHSLKSCICLWLQVVNLHAKFWLTSQARFKRRTLHVPSLMQMSENNRFFSFALDSAHVEFDVWTGPQDAPFGLNLKYLISTSGPGFVFVLFLGLVSCSFSPLVEY